MNIIPINSYERKDRPWVIRMLRYMGYLMVVLIVLFGISASGTYLTPIVQNMMGNDSNAVAIVVLILGAVGSFAAGLLVSLPLWGLAMLLDDIHAIRIQTAAYLAYDANKPAP